MIDKPTRTEALEAITTIIQYLGDDVTRDGLRGTPARVLKSWGRLFGGYQQDAAHLLKKTFVSGRYDQMVILGPIEFWSTCEHHMLPFYGSVFVGYIPGIGGRVVGISKLARVVEVYARRLQIQERLTEEIAGIIHQELCPTGVAVVTRAKHLCMVARGVEKQQSKMTTSAMLGVFRENIETRAEFLRLIEGQR